MQKIIIEKPYRFVPPHTGTWWPAILQWSKVYAQYLRRSERVISHECRNVDRLQRSIQAGHGILLTPNHCRTADPLVMGFLAHAARTHVFAMASWHLFNQDRWTGWVIRRMGAFSVFREGIDRQAIDSAIQILTSAQRPLIIFPEGATSHTNDHLHAMLDGVAFIARVAAKKRQKMFDGAKVVVHPVAIKYVVRGDFQRAADELLTQLESRLSWQPQRELPLIDRVMKLGQTLLLLKELEYFGEPRTGSLADRMSALINRLLGPLESHWFGRVQEGPVNGRVKLLRMKIMPEMIQNNLTPEERTRRWRMLADIQLAQQVDSYPPHYLREAPSVERILELIERFEEDFNERRHVLADLHAIIDVDDPIEVSPERVRPSRGREDDSTDSQSLSDPLMSRIESRLQIMLGNLAKESTPFSP